MSTIDTMARKLFGASLHDRAGKNIEMNINSCSMNSTNAMQFRSLLKMFSSGESVITDLKLLYVIINVGNKFVAANLIDDTFLFTLMVSNASVNTL